MAKSVCGGCHKVFTSVTAFDEHRTGSFALRARRCMTAQELLARGMQQNEKGWWSLPLSSTDAPWACAEETTHHS